MEPARLAENAVALSRPGEKKAFAPPFGWDAVDLPVPAARPLSPPLRSPRQVTKMPFRSRMLALALTLSLAPVQLSDEPAPAPILVEAVAVQCGEALITSREFERVFERASGQNPPRNREEAQRLQRELLVQLATVRLEEQAGADLGLDPQQVELITRMNLRDTRERAGLQGYLAELEKEGKDALGDERDSERRLLRYMWQYSVQGNAFAGRRATRDQTIRPGELRVLYAQNREQLAPEQVQLRLLIVVSEAAGGPEAARAACAEARARVLAGEDLSLIVEERASDLRDSRGLLPFWPLAAFRERLPNLTSFADTAEIGALSEVLPLIDLKTGQPAPELGYQLAMLHDRREPEVPGFDSGEVQRTLREVFTRQRRDAILERERNRLRREAYVWFDPSIAGGAPPAAAGPAGSAAAPAR
jgi:hypothetical protein